MRQRITSSRSDGLAIGALSERAGVSVETIRYYERIGLLAPPHRTEGRHRVFDRDAARRLQFVRRTRELGFSIAEIRSLLRLVDQGGLGCKEARDITERHLADIRERIADLGKLSGVLAELAASCATNRLPACPLLQTLSDRN